MSALRADAAGHLVVESAEAVVGLDVGGTKLAAGVVDGTGRVHSFLVEPTHGDQGAERVLDRAFELGRRAVAEAAADWSRIAAVGVACGGPLDVREGTASPLHLPGWRGVPIVAAAERAFDRPAVLANDATAAAAGEHRYGAGAGATNMVYLTISTGVGGGVVVGGRLYRGATGNAGELGHVTVDRRGRRCRGCGRRGCLEAYVSGTSIAERAQEAVRGSEGAASALAALERPTAADVAAAARAGDVLARAVWEETVAALACGLTSVVNAFEPEVVVVGGGVSRSGEQLLGPVRARVQAESMAPAGAAVRIVPSALGDHVGVVGAGAIAYDWIGTSGVVLRG